MPRTTRQSWKKSMISTVDVIISISHHSPSKFAL
jgi:hypothetical protein